MVAAMFHDAKLGLPDVRVITSKLVQTDEDHAAGRKGSIVTTVVTGKGSLGKTTTKAKDGRATNHAKSGGDETIVTLDVPVAIGDTLEIGTKTFTVISFEDMNPGAEATALLYKAVVE